MSICISKNLSLFNNFWDAGHITLIFMGIHSVNFQLDHFKCNTGKWLFKFWNWGQGHRKQKHACQTVTFLDILVISSKNDFTEFACFQSIFYTFCFWFGHWLVCLCLIIIRVGSAICQFIQLLIFIIPGYKK